MCLNRRHFLKGIGLGATSVVLPALADTSRSAIRGRRPNVATTQRMLFNVIFLLVLLIGILIFKHYAGERIAGFMEVLGPGTGSGTGVSDTSSLTIDVARRLTDQAIETAQEAVR